MPSSKRYETLWEASTSDSSDSHLQMAFQANEYHHEACKIDDTDELLSTSESSRSGELNPVPNDGDALILSDDEMIYGDDVAEASQVIPDNDLNALQDVESHSDIEEGIEPTVNDSYIENEAPSSALMYLQDLTLQLVQQTRRSLEAINEKRTTNFELPDDPSSPLAGHWQPEITLALVDRRTGNDCVSTYPTHSGSLRKIACVMKVAECLAQAIVDDVVVTKRDIFYRDVTLFRTQRVVDHIVDDIIATAGLRRRDFNVCASSKGLIASHGLKISLADGTQLALSSSTAALIPPAERIASIRSRISWVLIVEKDAIFNALLQSDLLAESERGLGAMVTGKGYPDLSTLQLLNSLSFNADLKFYALFDADPHGLSILSVYKHGSRATKYAQDYHSLGLGDRLQWLGVRASELFSLGIRLQDLLPLTRTDWTLALSTLRTAPDLSEDFRREISYMLHKQRKAEIQIIMTTAGPVYDLDAILDEDGVTLDINHSGVQRLFDYIISRMSS